MWLQYPIYPSGKWFWSLMSTGWKGPRLHYRKKIPLTYDILTIPRASSVASSNAEMLLVASGEDMESNDQLNLEAYPIVKTKKSEN